MAETVYKKISELPNATLPLAGTEYIEVSATGASKKGLWSGLFGAGWWAKLAAAFTAFKAPDSDHADNADTLGAGLETPTDFHDATQLVGAVPLANIPDELTGKNAATATLAANCSGDSATVSGIDPVNGNAGTDMANFTISANSSWIIPKGLYVIATGARLQIYSNGAWYGPEPCSGLVLSDGVNFRLATGSTPYPVYYRKLA